MTPVIAEIFVLADRLERSNIPTDRIGCLVTDAEWGEIRDWFKGQSRYTQDDPLVDSMTKCEIKGIEVRQR